MDERLALLIEMKDKLSKPLTDQQKALKLVNQQIRDLIKLQKDEEKSATKVAKEQKAVHDVLNKIRTPLQAAKDKMAALSRAEREAAKAAEEAAKVEHTEMVAGLTAAGAAVAAVVAGVGLLAAALASATIKTIDFTSAQAAMGEKLAASYTLFTRDAEQAGRTRDMIDDLAARMHLAPDKLHDTAHALLAAGIKPQLELQRSVAAVTALQKTGNEDAAKKLQGLFEKGAQSRRAFGGRGMIGITRSEAEEALGVGGWDQLQAAIKARGGGAIRTGYSSLMTTADVANKALADVITGGKVGDAARKMVGGLPEVFARLSAEIRRFFQGLSQGEGFRRFIESLHGVVDVLEAFGKQGGAKSTTSILDQGFKLLAKGVERGTILLIDMVTWTYKFATAVLKTYLAIKKWLDQGDRMQMLKGALLGIGLLLGVILLTVTLLAVAFAVLWAVILLPLLVIVGLFALLGIAFMKVTSHFKTWKQEATDAVAGLIDGLISGIRKGITAVLDASKQLGKGVITGVRAALDIKSPSREMMKLGAMSAQGFQAGLDGQSFSIGAIQAPALRAGGAGGSFGDIKIEVNIAGSTNMTEDELKPLVSSAFADAFEQLQLEMGSG